MLESFICWLSNKQDLENVYKNVFRSLRLYFSVCMLFSFCCFFFCDCLSSIALLFLATNSVKTNEKLKQSYFNDDLFFSLRCFLTTALLLQSADSSKNRWEKKTKGFNALFSFYCLVLTTVSLIEFSIVNQPKQTSRCLYA